MKKYKQLLTVLTVLVFTILNTSCNDSKPSNDQGYGSTMTPTQQQIDQQKIDQQNEQLRLEQQKIQLQQEEQRKAEEQRRQNIIAINTLLTEDDQIAKSTNKDYILTAPKMRMIDISKCPSDFAAAYIDHIHAWEDAAKIERAQNQLKEYGGIAAAAGLVATITGSEEKPFSSYLEAEQELKKLAIEKSEEILRTWKDIEHIAVSYGATLPK